MVDQNFTSPSDKIAIFLLAIGSELAADILKRLSKKEVERITAAMSRLGRVEKKTVDSIFSEVIALIENPHAQGMQASKHQAQAIITKAFGHSEFAQSLGLYLDQLEPRLEALDLADADLIARTISFEGPQTVALILAHCPPKKAAEILKLFSEGMQTEVIKRLAKLDKVDHATIQTLNEALEQALETSKQKGLYSIGGPKKAAAILNALSDKQREILDEIEQKDPELSTEIASHLLTFEDLLRLSQADMGTLLQLIDRSLWTMALRKASDALKAHVFGSLSERAGLLLKEDIENLGPQPISKVTTAQADIIKATRNLAEQGKIDLSTDPHEKVV